MTDTMLKNSKMSVMLLKLTRILVTLSKSIMEMKTTLKSKAVIPIRPILRRIHSKMMKSKPTQCPSQSLSNRIPR